MKKPVVQIFNSKTGEEIIREMDSVEFADYQADRAKNALRQAEAEAKAAARQGILSRLGITEEEARILLGGN